MGNSSGAFLAVQLHPNQIISGGHTVRGCVYLTIDKDNVTADSLNVLLVGRERTCVTYTVSSGSGEHQRTERREATQEHCFLSMDCVLAIFPGGTVPRGRYEFPFEMALPPGLPGKFDALDVRDSDEYFRVQYFLEARLHRRGVLMWDVKNDIELFVVDPPHPLIITPSFVEPRTMPVFFCCCMKRGSMTLMGSVDSVNVNAGGQVQVGYAIQ